MAFDCFAPQKSAFSKIFLSLSLPLSVCAFSRSAKTATEFFAFYGRPVRFCGKNAFTPNWDKVRRDIALLKIDAATRSFVSFDVCTCKMFLWVKLTSTTYE